MAIDKNIYDTLEVGAKNQIKSALLAGDKAGAEQLYQSFLPNPLPNATTPAQTAVGGAIQATNIPKVETPPINPITPAIPAVNAMPEVKATETPAPVTPTPTEKTTKPTEVGINVNQQRADEMVKNINEGYKNDAAIKQAIDSGDFEAFKSFYNMQSPEEAKVVEAYFQARQPKTADGFLNILKTGQNIYSDQIKSNPLFLEAQKRFDSIKRYSGYDTNKLASVIKSGELLPGTKEYNDLASDPVMKAKLDEANKFSAIGGKGTDIAKVGEVQGAKILANNPNISKVLEDGIMTGEELSSLLTNPDISNKTKEVENLKNKYDELKATYDNIETEVESEYKGRLSNSAMAALVADRRKGMIRDLQVATDTYNNALGTLTSLKEDQAKVVDFNIAQYNKMSDRAYAEQQAQKELQNQFDYTYGDLTSTDARIRKVAALRMAEAIQKQYAGMPFRRNVDVMANDILSELSKGKTTEQITTDITKTIQNAPTYQEWAMNKGLIKRPEAPKTDMITYGGVPYSVTGTTATPISGLPTLATGTAGGIDFKTLAYKYPNEASLKNNNPAGITWNANFDNLTPGSTADLLKSNGINFTKGTLRPAAEGGYYVQFPTVADGVKAYQLMWSPQGKYGNMNIGKALNTWGTGSLALGGIDKNKKVSDLSKEQLYLLQLNQLRKESPGFLKELINAGIVQKGQVGFNLGTQQEAGLSPADISVFNSLTPSDKKKMQNDPKFIAFKNAQEALKTSKEATIDDILAFSSGGKSLGTEEAKSLTKFDQALSQIDGITKQIQKMDTGPILGRLRQMNPYDTDAQVLATSLNSLIPNLARGVYGEVGVLTDNDIRTYARTVPNLVNTADVNKLVLAMTLDTVAGGYKKQLASLAAAGRDVSGYANLYQDIKNRAEQLKKSLNTTTTTSKSDIKSRLEQIRANQK